jgi:hypothetical protein
MTDTLVKLDSRQELAEFANDLKKFIVEQQLYTPIQGKNYVNVEGWQFAGSATGVLPVVKQLKDKSTDKEIRYQAKVELIRISDGLVLGCGIAVCSSSESKRKGADEYVIASMAQTRAIGKAYRNTLGFLMKMAGYEATPSEEMVDGGGTSKPVNTDVLDDIRNATSKSDLSKIMAQNSASDLVPFVEEIEKKKAELSNATA